MNFENILIFDEVVIDRKFYCDEFDLTYVK